MKILFLSQSFPYPPSDGIKLKVYNWLNHLCKNNEVTLLSFRSPDEEISSEYIDSMIKIGCKKVLVFSAIPQPLLGKGMINLLKNKPFSLHKYCSNEFRKAAQEIIKEWKPDIIHFDMINLAQYIDIADNIPSLISVNDSVTMFLKRQLPYTRGLRWIYILSQSLKFKYYEAAILAKFAKCHVVSEIDKNFLLKLNPKIDVEVIPNGVDIDYFRPFKSLANKSDFSIVFTGSWYNEKYNRNVDGIRFFFSHIYPNLKNRIHNLKIWIVGSGADRNIWLQNLKEKYDGINILGYVSDLRPYLDNADVYLCILRYATGIQNRVLEAMAMGKPIITTSEVNKGLKAINGRDLLVADTAEAFVTHIINLYNNIEYRQKLGKSARMFVERNYNWSEIFKAVDKLYESTIDKFKKYGETYNNEHRS